MKAQPRATSLCFNCRIVYLRRSLNDVSGPVSFGIKISHLYACMICGFQTNSCLFVPE